MRGLLAITAALAACASNATPPGDDDDSVPTGFQPLLAGDWTMPAGMEGYYCVRATAKETMYIQAYRPIAPLGTHHTALGIDLQGGPDGAFACKASDVGFKLLFGSGVGTAAYSLPDGVAFKLEAGTQVLLNLHLYNTSDAPINGRSGVEIQRVAPSAVVHEAETLYALHTDLNVTPGASTATGHCTIGESTTIVGLFPHMHRTGARMSATAVRGVTRTVFFDQPYSFEEQLNYATAAPVELANHDVVEYACGFQNTTGSTIHFGDSSDDEMCVLGMYRYPATGSISLCVQ